MTKTVLTLLKRMLAVLGYLWATPTTVLCVLLVLVPAWWLGWVRPTRLRRGLWEWDIVPATWLFWNYSAAGWEATTLGWVAFFSPKEADDIQISTHERRHVLQAMVMGPLYLPVYGVLSIAVGYWGNFLERDAYQFERQWALAHPGEVWSPWA
jgi:hypothetical protein